MNKHIYNKNKTQKESAESAHLKVGEEELCLHGFKIGGKTIKALDSRVVHTGQVGTVKHHRFGLAICKGPDGVELKQL